MIVKLVITKPIASNVRLHFMCKQLVLVSINVLYVQIPVNSVLEQTQIVQIVLMGDNLINHKVNACVYMAIMQQAQLIVLNVILCWDHVNHVIMLHNA